jgi:hypothetical protein
MPLELHIENANLSESHHSSLLITAWATQVGKSEVENFPGMVNQDSVTWWSPAARLIRAEIRPSVFCETVSSPQTTE